VLADGAAAGPWREPLELILAEGTLAGRIPARGGAHPDRARLREVYCRLCGCLVRGELFRG
jgi:hypothetical protein